MRILGIDPGLRVTGFREALNKSHVSRVAEKIEMVARSATQVVAGSTTPRSATKRALDFRATLSGRGFAGDPLCRSTCEGNNPSLRLASQVSSRKADRHGHAGLVQGFLSYGITCLRKLACSETRREQP